MHAASVADPVEAERVRRAARHRLFGEPIAPVALGRFEVRQRLGAGAMGVVYQAHDPQLERAVAIKLLFDDRAAGRLLEEARAMAAVRHPGLPAVYEVGEWCGHVFLAMEHVEGVTLRAWLDAEPRAAAAVLAVFAGAGRALAALHAAGLVHRDVKPENVVVDRRGKARLVDFGLARRAGADDGRVAGTLPYVAPELLAGAPASPASDQYALCVALERSGVVLPAAARHAVARGCAARPEGRFASLDALCDRLERDPRARPRRVAAAAGLLLAGAAAAALLVVARTRTRVATCDDGADLIGAIWPPTRRSEVIAAFDASTRPYAATSRDATLARLDAYQRGWQRARLDACEATHVRHAQSPELLDLRMICLERGRAALAATIEVVARADDAIVERAVALVEGLPAIDACADAAGLRATLPPPDSANLRAALAALEPRRAQASALALAGQFDRALPVAEALVDSARELGYRPFEAEALLALGAAQLVAEREDAGATLFDALKAGQASGHRDVVARAAIRLIALHARAARLAEARTFAGLAEASIEAVRGDPKLQVILDAAMLSLLIEENQPEAARVRGEAALTQLDAIGEDSLLRAALLSDLGNALDTLGRYDDASIRLGEALALRERLLGPGHPDIARTLNVMAIVVERLGKYDEALGLYQRGADAAIAGLGRDSLLYAMIADNQAGVLRELGRDPEALDLRMDALRIRLALAPGSSDLAISYNNVGVILEENGRYAEARTNHEQALALRIAIYGPDHTEVAWSWDNLGDVSLGEGDATAALAAFTRGEAIKRSTLGADHPDLIYSVTGMAKAHLAAGDARAAIAELERALRIAEASGAYPSKQATARFLLARAHHALGTSRARVVALAEAARAEWLALDRPDKVAEIDAWIDRL